MADVFDNAVPHEWRDDLWQLIRETPNLRWQLLTKRIGNAKDMLPLDWGSGYANAWLGAIVVNQDRPTETSRS
jgi:protein gp37